jgi:hypothetical protein
MHRILRSAARKAATARIVCRSTEVLLSFAARRHENSSADGGTRRSVYDRGARAIQE